MAHADPEYSGGVAWGPYQTVPQLLTEDARCSISNPMFQMVDQPGIGQTLAAGSPLTLGAAPRSAPSPAPRLGADTDAVLREVLALGDDELRRLHEAGVIARSDDRG